MDELPELRDGLSFARGWIYVFFNSGLATTARCGGQMSSIASGSIASAAEVAHLGSARRTHQSWSVRAGDVESLAIAENDGRHLAIEFECSKGESPTPAKQHEFRSDFRRDLARVEHWAADRNWPQLPIPEFHVVVSDRYRISKSLVPAWSGQAGRMEFPAWRVIACKAAIAHELVHVFFPNGNRMLAEGLAVYLQAEIGGNPAFPNFGRPLHELADERLRHMTAEYSLGAAARPVFHLLADLDAIATPSPLTLRLGNDFYGEEPRGQAHIYPIAGSFVKFLIELHGLERFRSLYQRTPLAPLQQDAGSPTRWMETYGRSLSTLESEWKLLIAGPVS